MHSNIKYLFYSLLLTQALVLFSCNKPVPGKSETATTATPVKSDSVTEGPEPIVPVASSPNPGGKDGYIIHISTGANDAYKVVMALQMASDLSANNDVLVYFDHNGISTAFEASPDLVYAPFPSSKKQISDLLSKSVKISVCDPCLKAAWKKPADLIKGITLGKPADFSTFSTGRIITLTY